MARAVPVLMETLDLIEFCLDEQELSTEQRKCLRAYLDYFGFGRQPATTSAGLLEELSDLRYAFTSLAIAYAKVGGLKAWLPDGPTGMIAACAFCNTVTTVSRRDGQDQLDRVCQSCQQGFDEIEERRRRNTPDEPATDSLARRRLLR